MMHEQGLGVPIDLATAYMWFSIATAFGDDRAATDMKRLAAGMTAEDVSEADERAEMCMASGLARCW